MLPFEDRHTRQRQLPEVGVTGQERIARLEACVSADASTDVELLYLRRAGAVRVVEGTVPSNTLPCPHVDAFVNPSAARFAIGAYRALARIRAQLGMCKEGT